MVDKNISLIPLTRIKGLIAELQRIEELIEQNSDKSFVFTQGIPSDKWSIAHNLGKFPSVAVVDSAGTEVIGDVQHIDDNNLTITFSSAFSGKAYLN